MREFSIEQDLKKAMAKLIHRDKETYEALMEKMDEFLTCQDVSHYKNLRSPLQHLKRVHIRGPFVLTFQYIQKKDHIIFYDLDHHDNIYM